MPGGQVKKHPAGYLAPAGPQVPKTQQRHQQLQAQAAVKVRTTHMHAGGGQHIAQAVSAPHAAGAQAHHGEVRGAPANVHHQHHCLVVNALFVVQRRRNRLGLEGDVFKACIHSGLAQRIFGLLIAHGVIIHKMHRAAHHHTPRHTAQIGLRLLGQHAQEQADDVLVADQLLVHRRLVLQQRAAQQAFERTHQPAFGAFQVLRNRIPPKVRAVLFRVEEQGGGQGAGIAFERNHARCALPLAHGHGRVGGTEVDAEGDVLQESHLEAGECRPARQLRRPEAV